MSRKSIRAVISAVTSCAINHAPNIESDSTYRNTTPEFIQFSDRYRLGGSSYLWMVELAAIQHFIRRIPLPPKKHSAGTSVVLSVWITVWRDYLCDLGTAVSEAAHGFWLRGWALLQRFPEISGIRLWELGLELVGEVLQDADAVLCGLWTQEKEAKE